MSDRPWYKRYPSDFLTSTVDMPFEEKGAYSIILDLIYDKGGAIEDEAQWISRVLGMSVRKWNSIRLKLIIRGKLVSENGFLTNKNATKIIINSSKTARESSENALKNIPKMNENKAVSNKISDIVRKNDPKKSPNTRNQSLDIKSNNKISEPEKEKDAFEKFWEVYPNPTGIGTARQSFSNQIFFKGADPDQIVLAAKAYAKKQSTTETKFIPGPAKWLDAQTYLDPDLQKSLKASDISDLPSWVKQIADRIGLAPAKCWFKDVQMTKDAIIFRSKFEADYVLTHFQLSLKDIFQGRKITFVGDK